MPPGPGQRCGAICAAASHAAHLEARPQRAPARTRCSPRRLATHAPVASDAGSAQNRPGRLPRETSVSLSRSPGGTRRQCVGWRMRGRGLRVWLRTPPARRSTPASLQATGSASLRIASTSDRAKLRITSDRGPGLDERRARRVTSEVTSLVAVRQLIERRLDNDPGARRGRHPTARALPRERNWWSPGFPS
jgi:hypothetical protein